MTIEDVIATAQGGIAGYKKPKHVFLVDDLPRNGTGKVLKHELRMRAERWLRPPSEATPTR
ncbi:acyl-CoA synthetase (AMP-forming)/AMP-acid ligase II [Bradyrhizobium sp. AZCC 1719]